MLQKDFEFASEIRKIDREVTSRCSGIAGLFRICAHFELLKKLGSLGSTVRVIEVATFSKHNIGSVNVSLKIEGASHYHNYWKPQHNKTISCLWSMHSRRGSNPRRVRPSKM
jgi:hypothetical protein